MQAGSPVEVEGLHVRALRLGEPGSGQLREKGLDLGCGCSSAGELVPSVDDLLLRVLEEHRQQLPWLPVHSSLRVKLTWGAGSEIPHEPCSSAIPPDTSRCVCGMT